MVLSVVVVTEPAVKLSCVMSEGKGSHISSNESCASGYPKAAVLLRDTTKTSRMLRLRHSSSNSLRVGLTKLNLLVGWLVYVWACLSYYLDIDTISS